MPQNVSFPFSWSLDKSVENVLGLLKSCISAATKDDIQAGAILAAERFGATLAMCPESRHKIEKLLDMRSDPVVVHWLKSTVGYIRGGSVDLLRQSMAGVNFLALVAPLLGTMDNFNVALVLETMIEKTLPDENDNFSLPTAYQLSRLMDILEPELLRIKFLEDVIYWNNWWASRASVPIEVRAQLPTDGMSIPPPKGIENIVDAFRRVSRVGDAKSVQITASSYAPWIAAFTSWSLGVPPNILFYDGTLMLEGSSPVTLIYSNVSGTGKDVDVEIFSSQESFAEILTVKSDGSLPSLAVGMVSMKVHANQSLLQLGFEPGEAKPELLGYRAMKEALPRALYQVRERCWRSSNMTGNVVNPFPSPERIATVARKYLAFEEPFQLQKPDSGWLVADVPLVRTWVEKERNNRKLRAAEIFHSKLAKLIADILALSLFDGCLDDIMLWSTFQKTRGFNDIIQDILRVGITKEASVDIILEWSLRLVKHDMADKLRAKTWLGSSSKGQVVFPKIYEHGTMPEDGFLELYCMPGVLMSRDKRNKVYRHIVASKTERLALSGSKIHDKPVTCVENLVGSPSIVWNVEDLEDGLGVAMGWSDGVDLLRPFKILEGIGRSMILKPCSHECQSPSPHKECDAYFQGLMDDALHASKPDNRGKIAVFPVFAKYHLTNYDHLTLLALGSVAWRLEVFRAENPSFAISQGACISCALSNCRKGGYKCLIL